MARYSIWIVSPTDYVHSHAFDEVGVALCSAFRELGHEADIVREPVDLAPQTIVLGCHLLHRVAVPIAGSQLILFNMEQISRTSRWLTDDYLQLLRTHTVWDYSARNVRELASFGIDARHCAIGYASELSRITRTAEDIDVLFYGSLNVRRQAVLEALARLGLRVAYLYGQYGEERDAIIARSKVVLNMHFYDAMVFEVVRVSYLLANRRCVLSETGVDREIEESYRDALTFARYNDLVTQCVELVQSPDLRTTIAEAGFRCVSQRRQVEYLRRVLAA